MGTISVLWWWFMTNPSQSFPNPSQTFVKDFKRVKSYKYRDIYLSIINPSRDHTYRRARARVRVRMRERVVKDFCEGSALTFATKSTESGIGWLILDHEQRTVELHSLTNVEHFIGNSLAAQQRHRNCANIRRARSKNIRAVAEHSQTESRDVRTELRRIGPRPGTGRTFYALAGAWHRGIRAHEKLFSTTTITVRIYASWRKHANSRPNRRPAPGSGQHAET